MAPEEYARREALLADVSLQAMQETNEGLADRHEVIHRLGQAYRNHFGLTPGEWNVARGAIALVFGLGGVLGAGAALAAAAADIAVLASIAEAVGPSMEFFDAFGAVGGIAGGQGQIALGAAQWMTGQKDDVPGFVTAVMTDPFAALLGVPYALIFGETSIADLESGMSYAQDLSFAVQGLSTWRLFYLNAPSLAKTLSAASLGLGAADLMSRPSASPSQSSGRDLFGAPAHYIWGNPQQEDPTKYDGPQKPNILGTSLPDHLGGTGRADHDGGTAPGDHDGGTAGGDRDGGTEPRNEHSLRLIHYFDSGRDDE
jgi:hypothetical protein